MAARLRHDERGLSLVLVAVTMVVLIGMVAFAVDVGAIYAERRELQNGATAAVLAIAEDCVDGLPCDSGTAMATAQQYADANATDLAADIYSLDLDTAAKTIEVTTQTEEVGGSTIFSPFFAQVIGFSGGTVGASAAAQWGYLTGGYTMPLIISDCEWEREAIGPPSKLDAGIEVTFFFHDGQAAEECNARPGHDRDLDGKLGGGFGWLDTSGSCEVYVEVGHPVHGEPFEDPGASPSTGCSASALADIVCLDPWETCVTNDHYVLVPWFDDLWNSGANGQYHVAGIGAMVVTGYNFGGQYKQPSAATAPCSGDDRCISGYLVTADGQGQIGGEDFGVRVVKLTG